MQARMAARGALVASMLVFLAPLAHAADQETFYLGTDGFPEASLVSNPLGGELPNFDRGRDVEPGLLLERSTLGLEETDGARYQHWQVNIDGGTVAGYPVVVIWSAPAGFDVARSTAFSVYLLDCNGNATDCELLASADTRVEAGSGQWSESVLAFDPIEHVFADWRYLGVRVVVSESSESDVMFAYGYPKQRSRLTLYSEPPGLPEAPAIAAPARPSSGDLKEKLHRSADAPATLPAQSDDVQGDWAWASTLVLSTIFLVGLGAVLLGRLTKPGRHERKTMGPTREPARRDRVPVSTG